jgi:hypothetical protein
VSIAGPVKTDFYSLRLNRSLETLLSCEHRHHSTDATISLEDLVKLRAQAPLRVLYENHEDLVKLRAQAPLRRVRRERLEKQTQATCEIHHVRGTQAWLVEEHVALPARVL